MSARVLPPEGRRAPIIDAAVNIPSLSKARRLPIKALYKIAPFMEQGLDYHEAWRRPRRPRPQPPSGRERATSEAAADRP